MLRSSRKIQWSIDANLGEGCIGFQLVVNVPFKLDSLSDAQLDISSNSVLLRRPEGVSGSDVHVPLPDGFLLDLDNTSARYSRKKQQLTLVCRSNGSPKCSQTIPELVPEPSPVPPATEAVLPPKPEGEKNEANDDDDDDDMPPPLEAAHSFSPSQVLNKNTTLSQYEEGGSARTVIENTETNKAAETLMQRALCAREQKQRETEMSRREAGTVGLKKGFLSSKQRSKKDSSTKAVVEPDISKEECVPFIAAPADPEAARREQLKLPEVQRALHQGISHLQKDNSWVTPQLVQAMQTRPDLLQGLSNPRIQEAIALMQKDPEQAKAKFGSDPEVSSFLKSFSSLMSTHFEVLSKDAGARENSNPSKAASLPTDGPQVLDPEVAKVMTDPEVQALLQALRAGRPLEMHELAQQRPHLFRKIKVLLDAGLLNVQR